MLRELNVTPGLRPVSVTKALAPPVGHSALPDVHLCGSPFSGAQDEINECTFFFSPRDAVSCELNLKLISSPPDFLM